jgi:hypothetical protein
MICAGFTKSSNVNVKDECGLLVRVEDRSKGRKERSSSGPKEAADFMINAVDATKGDNPWHASISFDDYPQEYDLCGATLISKRFLITGV